MTPVIPQCDWGQMSDRGALCYNKRMKWASLEKETILKLIGGLWLAYMALLAMIELTLVPLPPRWEWYYLLYGFNALLFLGLVSWPALPRLLGPLFMPLVIVLLSFVPITIEAVVHLLLPPSPTSIPEGLALRLLPVLFLGLMLIAWRYGWREVVLYCVGTAMFSLVTALEVQAVLHHPPRYLVNNLLLVLIRTLSLLLVGYFIHHLLETQRGQQEALAQANARLIDYADTVEKLAVSRERNRLARELHDTLAHTLSGLTVQLETICAYWEADPPTARQMLDKALVTARSGLEETRRALRALRASPVDDLGLVQALRQLATLVAERAGLELRLTLPTPPLSLRPDIEQAVYRVAQEALTNTARHAQARQVALSLTRNGPTLQLQVQDDGRGFDARHPPERAGLGLQGMRERAALVGGKLTLTSRPGQGTVVTLTIEEENDSRTHL